MTHTAPHPLSGERSPWSVPVALLALATSLAALGALRLPHTPIEPAPPRVEAERPIARPAALPVTPPPPAPEARAAVAVPASPPERPTDSACPPRWSVRFAHGSWAQPEALSARFARLRDFLAEHPRANVLVLGFADPEGSDRDNHVLSLRRATGVARALRRAGVDGERMTVRGIGALTALEDGASEYAEMRRVAVRVRGVAPCVGAAEEVVGP